MRNERLATKSPSISPRFRLTRSAAPPSDPHASPAAPECNRPAAPRRKASPPQRRTTPDPSHSRRKEDSKETESVQVPQSNQALLPVARDAFLDPPPSATYLQAAHRAPCECRSHVCVAPPYRKSRRT